MAIPMSRKTLGPVPNEGARQAWIALAERGWDQARLRREIREQTGQQLTSGTLVKYLYCDRRPGVLWTEVFKTVLGVDPGAWYRPPVESFLPPAAEPKDAA